MPGPNLKQKAEIDEILKGPAQIASPQLHSLGPGIGYVAIFADAAARITIDGIRQGRDGLKGDVRVEVGPFQDTDDWRCINDARLELSSMSQRETWERVLRKRWPNCGWDQVLHLFCAAVLKAEKRLDRPAIKLWAAPRPAVTGWLVEPLLLAGTLPTLWYGDGGTGKSILALAAALSIAEGIPIIGTRLPARRMRVLYCDFEFDAWEHLERLRRLMHWSSDQELKDAPEIDYLDCRGGTIVNQAERIIANVRALGSEAIIIDSLTYAAEGPLNDDETARLYYRALGSIGLTSLSICHTPKNSNTDTPFGSVHWRNLARLAWHFQLAQHERGEMLLRLSCKKSNVSDHLPDIGLAIKFHDGIEISTTDPMRLVAQQDEHWRRIQALLARENRPMTYEEIALGLGLEVAQVKARVNEHKSVFAFLEPSEGSQRRRLGLRAHEGLQ